VLKNIHLERPLVVLDLETTGNLLALSGHHDEVDAHRVETGAVIKIGRRMNLPPEGGQGIT
jgi:hypothetical protein